jgi:hypothetical protein
VNATPADPLGHGLLGARLQAIPGHIRELLASPTPSPSSGSVRTARYVVTGTGSSEAHARYLVMLLNLHADRAAAFVPLSAFASRDALPDPGGRCLVVFSQGVSPNAQIALGRAGEFAHAVLFTSSSPATARAAGRLDRSQVLERFERAGGERVEFPLAEEYTTLIRFVGPMAGYLAALRYVAALPGSRVKAPVWEEVAPLLGNRPPEALIEAFGRAGAGFSGGFSLVTAAPISDFAQNLACKFMEGLYWPCPPVSDFLQFAHGPFQQMTARPRPVLILQGASRAEDELVGRSLGMLAGAGLEAHVLKVNAPPLLSILGFEAALNHLVLALIVRHGVDQVNWPGKGRDDLLYGFCADL